MTASLFTARYEHISLSFVEMVGYYNEIFRNSRSQMFLKMVVLNNYANFTGKCSLLIKLWA